MSYIYKMKFPSLKPSSGYFINFIFSKVKKSKITQSKISIIMI